MFLYNSVKIYIKEDITNVVCGKKVGFFLLHDFLVNEIICH